MSQKQQLIMILSVLGLVLVSLVGCHMWTGDDRSPTTPVEVTAPGAASNLSNFIMGAPEITEWGAQYEEGNTYAMVNIPVTGALKIEYGLRNGGVFAIFLETTLPVELEIGLATREVDVMAKQVVDGLDWVCVTYEEGAQFASTPGNVEPDKAQDGAWTHYQRKEQNPDTGQEEVIPWWPPGAGFVFGGATQRVCVIEGGMVVVTLVSGPFPGPQPQPQPQPQPPAPAGSGDVDGDGVPDAIDNCPTVPNPQQVATDPNSGCRLIDNNDGTVTDMNSSYMWERVANSVQEDWNTATGASGHCATSTLGGSTDWRLPTRAEFQGLIDLSQSNPALPSGHPFTVQPVGIYWTSENAGLPPGDAWMVILNVGYVRVDFTIGPNYVWCLRG